MPGTLDTILAARGIRYSYGSREVLTGIDIEVGRGEIFGLLGPNGSGKSTLLSILTGMLPGQAGEVLLDGQVTSPTARAYRRSIGVVFQSAALDAKLSVTENLELVATMYGFRGAAARSRVERALGLSRLEDRASSIVGELSGGMRRRLDIARALLPEPRILFMDEPTTGLDEASYRALWQHLEEANRREGVTIVISTHRADEAERCGRLCVIDEGRAVAIASPAELCANLSRDQVVLTASDATAVAATLRDRLQVDASALGDEVSVACEDGHTLVPRIFEVLEAGAVTAAAVRRPGLADAYLELTGRSLAAEQDAA